MHSHQRALENARQPFDIAVTDKILETVDHGGRKRAIAPGTVETPVEGGGGAYFPLYRVRIGAPQGTPVKNPQHPWLVDWIQWETEVLAA